MATVYFSPVGNGQTFFNSQGQILAGGKIFTYAAGTTTPLATYTDNTGSVQNANPIILNSGGQSANEIWLTANTKFVIEDSSNNIIMTLDNIVAINNPSAVMSEWIPSNVIPTFLSTTQFSVPGDQTLVFTVNRRVKITETAGTVYGYVSASSFSTVTTVTVVLDSGVLDSGISVVYVGLLNGSNQSVPNGLSIPTATITNLTTTTLTSTTQSAGNNSTNVATTAFVQSAIAFSIQDFRLTLTTATPVTTSDVTGATTVYCTPYKGTRISLWNGTAWQVYSSAEFSIALGTLTSGKAYDVFAYQNAGVPTLELGTAWTNDTTRAVALAYQNGILVKSGDATRRYLGTFYTTATTTTEDSQANRYLWNYYNRVARSMKRIEPTASWTYTTATWRQSNGSTANQLNFIVGVAEDEITARVDALLGNTSAGIQTTVGIALDSVTVPSRGQNMQTAVAGISLSGSVSDEYQPSAGRHYISWLEWSQATGTTTWFGTTGDAKEGLTGRMMA